MNQSFTCTHCGAPVNPALAVSPGGPVQCGACGQMTQPASGYMPPTMQYGQPQQYGQPGYGAPGYGQQGGQGGSKAAGGASSFFVQLWRNMSVFRKIRIVISLIALVLLCSGLLVVAVCGSIVAAVAPDRGEPVEERGAMPEVIQEARIDFTNPWQLDELRSKLVKMEIDPKLRAKSFGHSPVVFTYANEERDSLNISVVSVIRSGNREEALLKYVRALNDEVPAEGEFFRGRRVLSAVADVAKVRGELTVFRTINYSSGSVKRVMTTNYALSDDENAVLCFDFDMKLDDKLSIRYMLESLE